MTALTEGRHTAEFILSEAFGQRSRDRGTLLADEVVVAGQVLSQILPDLGAADASVAALVGGNANGTLTLANPKTTATAKEGLWKVECIEAATDAGVFNVVDPDGQLEGVASVGVAYDGSIKFTIADGSNDFAAGDYFPVTVTRADPSDVGSFKALALGDTDGGAIAAAIALDNYDATGADLPIAFMSRDAEVNGNLLTWPDAITDNEKAAAIAQLAAHGIVVRT